MTDLTTSKTNVVLDYKSVKVGGNVTTNGVKPAVTAYCSKSKNPYSNYVQVSLTETTWGYKYSVAHRCDKADALGFAFNREIFPGTYKIDVYGTTGYANFPVGGTQVIHPTVDLNASKTDLVLDYKSVKVGGSVTTNGVKPAVTAYCSKSKNPYSNYVQVSLTETTWGYNYSVAHRCDQADALGFAFNREIFPGTYKIDVYGTTGYANFPVGGTQVIYPSVDLGASKTDLVLDYKSVKVGGTVTTNGVKPAVTKYCSKSSNPYSNYVQISLTETTWGYKYSVAHRCDQADALGFAFNREIFPGTYKIDVYGTTGYANFPIGGTQVVVPKVQLK